MNLLEAINNRRAVRDYIKQPVDDATITRLIDAAIQAPSAMNRQAWHFVVVTDPVVLDSVAHKAKLHMLSLMDSTPMLSGFRDHLSKPEFNIFYQAPVLVVICAMSDDRMAEQDCCLAAENLMLAARAEDLGSCWIGFAEAWLALPEAKAELGLPDAARPVAPIILGHPRAWPTSPGRRPANLKWIRSGNFEPAGRAN
jgi:nitroreductase